MKHTPGPWETEEYKIIAVELGSVVANFDIYDRDASEEEMGANARLIAAAPDLLRLLEEAFVCLEIETTSSSLQFREEVYNKLVELGAI